jgi:hypothetical protein
MDKFIYLFIYLCCLLNTYVKILLHEELYILYLLHYVDNEWKWLERINGSFDSVVFSINIRRNENLNLLVQIKFLNLFLYGSLKKNCFTGTNKALLVLGRRTGAHHED